MRMSNQEGACANSILSPLRVKLGKAGVGPHYVGSLLSYMTYKFITLSDIHTRMCRRLPVPSAKGCLARDIRKVATGFSASFTCPFSTQPVDSLLKCLQI